MYVDDLVLYCKADMSDARAILDCLTEFFACSGQQINFTKSSIHFSSNTSSSTKASILRLLGMVECDHKGSYLGLPFCRHQPRLTQLHHIVERVKAKLTRWKVKVLSFAGRGVLVKSVIQSIPSYAMQTLLLPKTICSDLDGLARDFWWGKAEAKDRHLYLKAWTSLCAPKEAGGLGF